jgi:hypothetical protein
MPHPSPPQSQAGVSGEIALAAAIVRQALLDAQSRRAPIRQEAEQFWQDDVAVAFWAAWLGLDGDVLRAYVQRALRSG